MERFKVSGEELRNFYQEDIPLSKVFCDIEQELRAENQVVCRYIINGLEIPEADEEKFSSVTLKQVETLEYLTENSRDLTGIVLRGWIEALPELMQNTEKLAQRMRSQGLKGLLRSIHELVENCECLIDSTVGLRVVMGDQMFLSRPLDWGRIETQSKKTVTEALQALESKNFILLADVLEYDLNHMLQMWHEHLRFMERTLNGEHSGTYSHSQQTGPNSLGRKRIAN